MTQRDDSPRRSTRPLDALALLEADAGMFAPLLRFVAAQPRWLIAIESAVTVGAVGWVDIITPSPDSILPILYLLPIVVATWFVSLGAGAVLGALATAMWLAHDALTVSAVHGTVSAASSAIVRLCFFLVMLTLIYGAKRGLLSERSYARADPLTGVANVRAFEERLEFSLAYLRRTGMPLTLAYIDVDDFKVVNDRAGHHEGDIVLCAVAGAIAGQLRSTDLLARLGGDEFCIILPDTGADAAPRVMEKIAPAVADSLGARWGVTLTAGVVTFTQAPENVDSMVRAADQLMYQGKHKGKARVCYSVWPDGGPTGAAARADRDPAAGESRSVDGEILDNGRGPAQDAAG